jgi:PPOX class probable F420-dependent enzyme
MELHDALEFIRDRHRGVLVTLKQDGRPQLSNIGYVCDDDGVIRVSVTDSRAKTNNARRDPRVALYVTRDDFYAYAVVEGRAELSPVAAEPADATVGELIEQYRGMAGEHPDWDDFRRAMVADGRLILRLHAERAYGMLPAAEG